MNLGKINIAENLLGVLEALDEAGNAAFLGGNTNIPLAGNPHATISQVMGQMLMMGTDEQKTYAKIADKILTKIQNGLGYPTTSHCLDALKNFPPDLPRSG